MWRCVGGDELKAERDNDDIERDAIAIAGADADAIAVTDASAVSGTRNARADGRPDTAAPSAHRNTVRDPAGRRWRRRRRQLRRA